MDFYKIVRKSQIKVEKILNEKNFFKKRKFKIFEILKFLKPLIMIITKFFRFRKLLTVNS